MIQYYYGIHHERFKLIKYSKSDFSIFFVIIPNTDENLWRLFDFCPIHLVRIAHTTQNVLKNTNNFKIYECAQQYFAHYKSDWFHSFWNKEQQRNEVGLSPIFWSYISMEYVSSKPDHPFKIWRFESTHSGVPSPFLRIISFVCLYIFNRFFGSGTVCRVMFVFDAYWEFLS